MKTGILFLEFREGKKLNIDDWIFKENIIMKNRPFTITLVLLLITIGNSFIFFSKSDIRAVEFVYIFVIGVLSGVLLMQIIISKRNNK